MIKLVTTIVTLFWVFNAASQNQLVIDSLLTTITAESTEEERVDTYVRVALEYGITDTLQSNGYLKGAMQLADSIDYSKGKADVWYVRSRNLMLLGAYDASEMYLNRLIDLSKKIDYPKGLSNGFFGLGWLNYYHGNYQQSVFYHEQSLEVRRTLENQEDISTSLRGIGITYKLLGDFDNALIFLRESLSIEQEIAHPSGIAECLNHIGVISSLRGDYPSALDAYYQALEIQKEVGDKSGLAYTYQNIGVIHDQQNDFEKTLEYYERSLELRQELGETRGIAQIIYNMGIVYHEMGEYSKAYYYYSEALEMKEQLGDQRGVADGYLNIGRLYDDQEAHREAISYQDKALKIAQQTNSSWIKVNALIGLGGSYTSLKSYEVAKRYLDEAMLISKKSNLIEGIRESARFLTIVEREMGNYKKAYEAHELYHQILDSLSNEEVAMQIAFMEAEYRFEQERDSIQFENERERLRLDQQLANQRNAKVATIVTAIVLLILLVILYGYYRFKSQAINRLSQLNRRIQESNDSLQRLNEEKNNLIGIVAHDLKNPLSAIMGAISMIEKEGLGENDRKLMHLISDTSSRMSTMISGILNVQAIEKRLEEKLKLVQYDLSESVAKVVKVFVPVAAQKKIKLNTELGKHITILADDRFVVQVVENLISNAIKFSPFNKEVSVVLKKKRGKVRLEVRDEGPGLSSSDKKKLFQRFQRLSAKPTGNESSTGLGLSIVKEVVEKMDGKVWAESALGVGTSFFVEFKVAR